MYDSFAASCDQPIHLINIISISNLAMNLPKKKKCLYIYIFVHNAARPGIFIYNLTTLLLRGMRLGPP